jgi:predicted TIM-barrel fold metal-dependent hydrolase
MLHHHGNRRQFLWTATALGIGPCMADGSPAQERKPPSHVPVVVQLNDVDRRIWTEELHSFVPRRVFDVHNHYYRWALNTSPDKETGHAAGLGRDFPEADRARSDAWDALLLPGRKVQRLSFGCPLWSTSDFGISNRFVAEQESRDPSSAVLMMVHPGMSCDYIESQVREHGFLGFKPYRMHATTGDPVECRITDFLPEQQIAIAHRHRLLIMLHIAKRDAIADQANIDDLVRLTSKYPNAQWILAHCARSYSAWAIERAAKRLRGLPNIWYDTSSVCESDAIEALINGVGPDRVMYGSDNPVGVGRGKYIAFGYAWAYLSETNHTLGLAHCNPQMTFVLYEQIRAMRRAAIRLGLARAQIDDLFYNTAARLVQSARHSQ